MVVGKREGKWLGHLVTAIPDPTGARQINLGSRTSAPAFLSLPKMATKEDQDILRLLVQYVSRAFYEPKFTIIMDQLARNPV